MSQEEPNFEREVAKSPTDKIIIDILIIRKEVIDTIEKNRIYNKAIDYQVKNKIKSLYYYLRSGIKRDNNTLFNEIEKHIDKGSTETHIQLFLKIDEWLDTKRIIRVDNIKHYDRTSAEKENRQRGYH